MQKMDLVDDFIEAYYSGKVCLHPSDTLPGYSATVAAFSELCAVKGRSQLKNYVCLAASVSKALEYFAPLPEKWSRALGKLWPGYLSVVYKADSFIPKELCNDKGGICLRVPTFPADHMMHDILGKMPLPFVTTSVNAAGNEPAVTWAGAIDFSKDFGSKVYIPWLKEPSPFSGLPSTIIEIFPEQDKFKILRKGAFDLDLLQNTFSNYEILEA